MSVSAAEPSPASTARRGDLLTLRCGRMVHGGLCLASDAAAGSVLVAGAIPDELVEARLHHRVRRTWFADVESVLEPSPDRVAAPCPYVPACGGCQLQHIGYARQLQLKRDVLADALRRQGISVSEIGVHGMSDPWRYRARGEFHVVRGAETAGAPGLGFNRARSWRPIAVDDCLIHDRRITGALPQLRGLAAAHPQLRTLQVTAGDADELLVRGGPGRALTADALDHLEGATRWSTEWTSLHWRDGVFRVSGETFIQVNRTQLDVLYGLVLDGLGDAGGRRIVDAYAGVGMLACVLAREAGEVVCIESNRAAARAGVLNARLNEVSEGVRYLARAVEDALPEAAAESPVDAVILDPPRAGCDARVSAWLALAGPPRIVYVSCDPATLARDLHILVASGPYRPVSVNLVDMFAQTYHVETVVVLSRADPEAQSGSGSSAA